MSALSAVIFDVDGTLVDSERDGHRVAFNAAFEEAGLPDRWDVVTYGGLLRVAGGAQRLAHWFEQHGRSASEARSLAQRLHPRKTRIMRDLVEEGRIGPRPGVVPLLDELEAAGVHLHVATTGTRAWVEPLLDRVFGDRFRTVLTGSEIPDLKPSPAVYEAVLRVAGCSAEDTVAVEDSANGVAAAVAAGLRCVAAHNPYTRDQDMSGAALVTDGFTDPELTTWFRTRLDRPGATRGERCVRRNDLPGWHGGAMTPDVLEELVTALPAGVVVTSPTAVDKYREDFARDGSAGTPIAVVRPETALQVQQAVRWAARYRVPVVARGAGTGLSGGSSAVDGGITISLDRMRSVQVDAASQVAVVEPGALNVDVKRAAAEHGLWYPPDPSSYEICSIGGNLATNAGGLCCVKYGVTTDYVLGMDVVLADGTLVTLGGKRIKDVAGLSLLKLFVGSEGTLGIITRGILRLVPAQTARATVVSSFPSMTAASRAVVAIRSRVRSSMLELMDNATINAVEDWRSHGLDRSTAALLIAQSDAPGAACGSEVEIMQQCCEEADADDVFTTTDPDESEAFVAARRNAFHAVEHRGSVLFEDVGVPVPLLPDLVNGIAAIAARRDVEIAVVAHAGDGNTHPLVVYDAADPSSVARARDAFDDVMALAITLGGTITGEHGVGRAKKAALPDQLGADVIALTRRVKDALDPDGILNPGAVL